MAAAVASPPTVFGGRKMRGGRDPHEEIAALQWIYSILREPLPNAQFDELLKDGQVLCRLMQRIEPSLIRKINTGGGPIKLMENHGIFTDACRALGVRQSDLFQSTDLFEKRDIGALQRIRPDLPAYGPKIAEDNKRSIAQNNGRTFVGLSLNNSSNVPNGSIRAPPTSQKPVGVGNSRR
ncbi:putative Myophilin [Hypsibius exemplaris]|uniref:Myophilin n=1 Tax=Hypsibius exemplaris TaxID=2072580 RepID=A0A9X6NJZ6_HYPEX|nr:putative Myophilin [Hypsibius exemplaris]